MPSKKCIRTTQQQMVKALIAIKDVETASTNFNHATSLFGLLAMKLWNTNTIEERKFLFDKWNAGLQAKYATEKAYLDTILRNLDRLRQQLHPAHTNVESPSQPTSFPTGGLLTGNAPTSSQGVLANFSTRQNEAPAAQLSPTQSVTATAFHIHAFTDDILLQHYNSLVTLENMTLPPMNANSVYGLMAQSLGVPNVGINRIIFRNRLKDHIQASASYLQPTPPEHPATSQDSPPVPMIQQSQDIIQTTSLATLLELFNRVKSVENLAHLRLHPESVYGVIAAEMRISNTVANRTRLYYRLKDHIQAAAPPPPAVENPSNVLPPVHNDTPTTSHGQPNVARRLFRRLKNAVTPGSSPTRKQARPSTPGSPNSLLLNNTSQQSSLPTIPLMAQNSSDEETDMDIQVPGPSRLPARTTEPEIISQPDNAALISTMLLEYDKHICSYTTKTCGLCERMIYPSCSRSTVLSTGVREKLAAVGQVFEELTKLTLCFRCYNNNRKGNLTPQVFCNNMRLPAVPRVLSDLTEMEVRLISQVKVYMKIFHLTKGRGQFAFKGFATHFAQQVQEITTQLPLATNNSDFIMVAESMEGLESERKYQIRPAYISEALLWLKNHNPLYRHVQIVSRTPAELSISTIVAPRSADQVDVPPAPNDVPCTYKELSNGRSILHGSFHQHNMFYFPVNYGRQCTAMSTTAIAYSAVQPPDTWTITTMDEILIRGDIHDTKMRVNMNPNHDKLLVEEAMGIVDNCFGNFDVRVDSNDAQVITAFHSKIPGSHLKRIPAAVEELIAHNVQYSIVTANGISMAIILSNNCVYFFDSHSRGPAGLQSGEGFSCCIKLQRDLAPAQISFLINSNSKPGVWNASANEIEKTKFVCTITPVSATVLNIQPAHDSTEPLRGETQRLPESNRNNDPDSDDENIDGYADDNPHPDRNHRRIEIIQDMVEKSKMDSVIMPIDYDEPSVEEFFKLHRATSRPLNPSEVRHVEELAFFNCFPTGVRGLDEERPIKITPLDYFQQRVMGSDPRFQRNDYLFYALSRMEDWKIKQKIGVCGNMRTEFQANDDAPDLPGLMDPHTILSSIRGTSSYWKRYMGDLLAMTKQLGCPTFFLTISYDDLNAKDVINALYKAKNGPNAHDIDVEDLPFEERRELLNEYPVVASRHFTHRLKKFIAILKKYSVQIFGYELKDYSVRVEFQARGSPHGHFLLWLGTPEFSEEEKIGFIDRNVSCSVAGSTRDLVTRYQNHHHTATCYKKANSGCRFAFPRKPSPITEILGDDDIIRNNGRAINLKRTPDEIYINNYHPILLPILKCNMDIQYVTGAMAVSYYIAKYVSKSEPEMLKPELRNTLELIRNNPTLPSHQKILKQTMVILKMREVSAPEAAFRLCHLPLRDSSRSFVFIPTYMKHNRTRMLRPDTYGDAELQFYQNIIDKYCYRPRQLENICLLEFAAEYESTMTDVRMQIENDFQDDDDVLDPEFNVRPQINEQPGTNQLAIEYNLLQNRGKIKRRTKPAIVKHPYFDPVEDRKNYLYSLMLLYHPFRDEIATLGLEDNEDLVLLDDLEILEDIENRGNREESEEDKVIKKFKQLYPNFRTHAHNPIVRPDLVQEIDSAVLRITDLAVGDFDEEAASIYEPADEEEIQVNIPQHQEQYPPPDLENFDVNAAYRSLNPEQREVFEIVNAKLRNPALPPVRLKVIGEGGCGKSYVIKNLRQYIMKYLSHTTGSPVILATPTGVSAKLIKGVTLHRAFGLAVEKGGVAVHKKLSGRNLERLRRQYKDVKWVFIDELSMMSYQVLRQIHLRLTQIFNPNELFGGLNIILFGDLLQLKPVFGKWIFERPDAYNHEPHYWDELSFVELKQNHRQASGDPLFEICHALREGNMQLSHMHQLQDKVLNPTNPNYAEKLREFDDCLWIFPTNALADAHNLDKATKLQESGVETFEISAIDTYRSGPKLTKRAVARHIPVKTKNCGGIPKTLLAGIGSRVMLLQNKSVENSLVNGSTGTVAGFKWTFGTQLEPGEQPEEIYIKFDDQITGGYLRPDGTVAIKSTITEFDGVRCGHKIGRKMPALTLSWGCTVHKIQGATLDKAVINLGKALFTRGQAYVALSRVKTFAGLAISELCPSKLLTKDKGRPTESGPHDMRCLREIQKLRDEYLTRRMENVLLEVA